MDDAATRKATIARIAAHFCSLRVSGVMAGGSSATTILTGGMPDEFSTGLVNLARFLHAVHRLSNDVLPSAEREPGRYFARAHKLEPYAPRGAVSWTRTVRHRIGRESMTATEHVCRVAQRTLTAPENILLLSTLLTTLRLGSGAMTKLREQGVLQTHDYRAFVKLRQVYETLRLSQSYRPAWEHIRSTGIPPTGRLPEIEAEVDKRTRFRPSTAPQWARRLLNLQTDICDVPNGISAKDASADTLWTALAKLETLVAIQRAMPIRWIDSRSVAGWRDVRLEAREREGYWLLREHKIPIVCVTWSPATSWQEVRTKAVMAVWEARCEESVVDKWIVLHRCTETQGQQTELRGNVALHFSRVSLDRVEYPEVRDVVSACWSRSQKLAHDI